VLLRTRDVTTTNASLDASVDPSPRLGATPTASGTRFALWTTTAQNAAVRLYATPDRAVGTHRLSARGGGVFEGLVEGVRPGALYRFVLDDRELPDPFARFLPYGVHGPARVERVGPRPQRPRFTAPPLEQWTIYELHLGTFTPEGTWAGARAKLGDLARLGVSAIEVMPVGAFDGARGWGYDGVAPLAPYAPYGEPDDVRAFVDAAHGHGLAVILDAVFNHFGPSGSYWSAYAPEYFVRARGDAKWGDALDFTQRHLRAMVLEAARTWLVDYGFDGLRLDATHAIADPSPRHILAELAAFASSLSPKRVLVAEDERNDPRLVTSYGLDAVWADDFHHAVHVLLTGERDGYYGAYEGTAAEVARAIEHGWLYEGQTYAPTGKPRGRPATELSASRFVYCAQNHDQIGNRAFGTRLHQIAGIDAHCAASMLLLFLPMVPLLFMGDEWAASSPFLYFTDHEPRLGEAITEGRRAEFAHFAAFADAEARTRIPDPQAPSTFARSRLDWDERAQAPHARVLALYEKMLRLRAADPVLAAPSRARLACEAHGALLVARRWLGADERVLLFNAGEGAVRAPFAFGACDVMLASREIARTADVPPRCAILVKRRV
jgi:maltooligosyltrehalose trehalohydrolase